MKLKISKKILFIIIPVIVILAILAVIFTGNKKEVTTKITKVMASRGTIINTISGSGTITPIEEYYIVSTVKGDILTDNVTVGEEVQEGQELYTIDRTDAETKIRKTEIALEKQKLSYNQTLESKNNLIVTSTIDGVISKMYIEEGDNINSGGKIADVVDSKNLLVTMPFNSKSAKNIKVNDTATVYVESTGESFIGKVQKVATGSYVKPTGALVSDVEISFTNPGALLEGEIVTAVIGEYSCNESGQIKYKSNTTITAKTSGTIDNLYFNSGDKISVGDVVATIENDSAVINEQSGLLSLEDAELALKEAQDDLASCYITSPVTGIVTYKYYKAGDTVTSDSRTNLAVVADMSKVSFSMSIDELDIKKINVGQEVLVTADALENTKFNGVITEIGITGTTQSSVTTYPVTVVIDEYEGLLPGMNVTAEIVLEEAEDVVIVPVSAVSRGNVVLVKEEIADDMSVSASTMVDKKDSQPGKIMNKSGAPEGYKYIKVTTGLSDGEFIEVKEGLSENDEVYVVTIVRENTQASNGSSSGMMGGMPSGMTMPSGGMPSGGFGGGMPSGNFGSGMSGNRGQMSGGIQGRGGF